MATSTVLKDPSMKLKICLVGEGAVGKTSLIQRFVHDAFQDRYVATLGTRVTKKELQVKMPGSKKGENIFLMIWDVMGQKTVRDLLRDGWFHGSHGILMVCDMTRRHTLEDLEGWKESVEEVAGVIPSLMLANKSDLTEESSMQREDLEVYSKRWGCPYILTSAKTGEGVERAFEEIARLVLNG
ncbi:MAG: Rab family GTPase [Thermoplasmata archaeon]